MGIERKMGAGEPLSCQDGPEKRGTRIGLFAKHWAPGKAKTRLAAKIGKPAASEAAQCFIEATLARLTTLSAERVLAFTPASEQPAFEALPQVRAGDWQLALQPDLPKLGERMRWFFETATSEGAAAALLVGSDSPDLPLDAVARAAEWLRSPGPANRLVLGPTSDGGYWLIGSRGEPAPVFEGLPWSTPELLTATIARLEEAGWREGEDYLLIDQWYDVDTAEDLAALQQRIAKRPEDDKALTHLASRIDGWLDEN